MDDEKSKQSVKRRLGRGVLIAVVGLFFLVWLLNTPSGLLGKADAVGYAVCHRIDARSFHIGERALPLCARCSGMYLGAMLGLLYMLIVGPKRGGLPPKRVLIVLGMLGLAFIIDSINSYLHLPFFSTPSSLYEPSNTMRLLTGTGMGIVIAAVLYPSLNQTIWRDWSAKPALGDLRSIGILILLGLLLDVIILSENPIVLYPLALISALGVIVLLTLVYAMLWLIITHSEGQIKRASQLFIPLVAGFGMALLQIAALDFLRFIITGTWQGFSL